VESYPPAVGGMPEVVRQLSERMVKLGHRVTVHTSSHPERTGPAQNGVLVRSYKVTGNALEGFAGEADVYWNDLRSGNYDVVTLFAAQQWATDLVLPRIKELGTGTVFVPTGFSKLHDPSWSSYYDKMAGWLKDVDMNVFLGDDTQDKRFASAVGASNFTIIPNGASEEEFEAPVHLDIRQQLQLPPDIPIILHVGGYTGYKGHDEAIRIFLKGDTGMAVLLFVGTDMNLFMERFRSDLYFLPLRFRATLQRKDIRFLQADRATTVAAMRQADLFLFPSRIECSPIVLFECMAAGLPFLASDAGNSAEIVNWSKAGWIMPGEKGSNGLVTADINGSAHMLSSLLRSPAQLEKASVNGQKIWKEKFTWRTIADRYFQLYQKLSASPQ
jgi:glycosyltransferase involved in cell wall biosynthesis